MAEGEKDLIKATVRGFSRGIILWLISQKSMSGYKVLKELERLSGQKLTPGIVYPLLYEMEKKDLVDGKWMKRGRRRIKYYSITEEGIKTVNHLRKALEMPVKEMLNEFIKENTG